MNKMRVHNVAIVFGPTLMRPPPENLTAVITDAGMQSRVVEHLMLETDWVFDKEGATLQHDPKVRGHESHTCILSLSPHLSL